MTAGHGDEAAARDWPQVPGYRVNRAGDRDDAGAWFTARSVVTHDEVRIRHLTQPTARTIGDVGAASRLAPLPVEIVDLAEAGVAAVYPIAEVVTLTDVLAGVGLLTAGQTATVCLGVADALRGGSGHGAIGLTTILLDRSGCLWIGDTGVARLRCVRVTARDDASALARVALIALSGRPPEASLLDGALDGADDAPLRTLLATYAAQPPDDLTLERLVRDVSALVLPEPLAPPADLFPTPVIDLAARLRAMATDPSYGEAPAPRSPSRLARGRASRAGRVGGRSGSGGSGSGAPRRMPRTPDASPARPAAGRPVLGRSAVGRPASGRSVLGRPASGRSAKGPRTGTTGAKAVSFRTLALGASAIAALIVAAALTFGGDQQSASVANAPGASSSSGPPSAAGAATPTSGRSAQGGSTQVGSGRTGSVTTGGSPSSSATDSGPASPARKSEPDSSPVSSGRPSAAVVAASRDPLSPANRATALAQDLADLRTRAWADLDDDIAGRLNVAGSPAARADAAALAAARRAGVTYVGLRFTVASASARDVATTADEGTTSVALDVRMAVSAYDIEAGEGARTHRPAAQQRLRLIVQWSGQRWQIATVEDL
ncbi:MAG: hypothetical protein LKG20_10685 [Tetrasphaera jenkinsii]|jgi:hypothetical protein|nr:hypothetical protein [Tetrasphaera jenkinsii]